jgi:hypothetical protein
VRRTFYAGLAAAGCALLLTIAPAVAGAAPFTWKGEAATSEWTKTENWSGGVAPSGSVETLSFPKLANPECAGSKPKVTCYVSFNDVSGISAKGISIDDGSPYRISGNGISLGSGGLTAKPEGECSGEEFCGGTTLGVPLTLTKAQTWSISGVGSALSVSEIESEPEVELKLSFANNSLLELGELGLFEVGKVSASGEGTIAVFGESLNWEDEEPIKLTKGTNLFTPFASIGPLEASEDEVQVGNGFYVEEPEEPTVLHVEGNTTLGPGAVLTLFLVHSGSQPGIDYSQLNVRQTLKLAGVALNPLVGAEFVGGKFPCSHLTPGTVETLVSAEAIEGEFTNAKNGAELKPEFCLGEGPGPETQPLRIAYTHSTVTATVLESKEEKRHHEEEAAARKHAEEEAAAKKRAEEEAAARKHAEEEAARKHAEEEAAARKRAEEEAAHRRLEEQLHPTLKIVKIKVTAKGLQVTLELSQPGTVTLGAPGCKKVSKTLAAGVQHVTLKFNSKGKRERAQRKRIKLSVQLNDGHASVNAAKNVKL